MAYYLETLPISWQSPPRGSENNFICFTQATISTPVFWPCSHTWHIIWRHYPSVGNPPPRGSEKQVSLPWDSWTQYGIKIPYRIGTAVHTTLFGCQIKVLYSNTPHMFPWKHVLKCYTQTLIYWSYHNLECHINSNFMNLGVNRFSLDLGPIKVLYSNTNICLALLQRHILYRGQKSWISTPAKNLARLT